MPAFARRKKFVLTQSTVDPQATEQEIQKIHIGNLATASSETGVREMFAAHGEVRSYERPLDKTTSAPLGFAFLEMPSADALKAITALDGKELDGQALRVTAAKSPRA